MAPGNPTINTLATAYMFLDVPLWQMLFWRHYEKELATSMSWAFTQGVAQLLSSVVSGGAVPVSDILVSSSTTTKMSNNDDEAAVGEEEVVFKHTVDLTTARQDDKRNDQNTEQHGGQGETNATTGDTNATDALSAIFQEKVVQLFLSTRYAFSETDPTDTAARKLEVCLRMKPYETEFLSLYCIPYLSRQNSQSNPQLLSFYKTMLNKPPIDRVPDLNRLRNDHLEHGHMESTIIAQCIVWCQEVFYLRDVNTGAVGHGNLLETNHQEDEKNEKKESQEKEEAPVPESIPHLVRMERTVTTTKDPRTGAFHNVQGDWIITDIDDLLEGNLVV